MNSDVAEVAFNIEDMMDTKKVRINRDSVCMGDDVQSHAVTLEFSQSVAFMEIFRKLIEQRYFPFEAGSDVVWVMTFENKDCIAWITKQNEFMSHYDEKDLCFWLHSDVEIFFRYYSSRDMRSKYICKRIASYIKEYEKYGKDFM